MLIIIYILENECCFKKLNIVLIVFYTKNNNFLKTIIVKKNKWICLFTSINNITKLFDC